MKYLYLILNWFFGCLFLLAGLFTLFTNLLAALALIAISVLLLPPARSFIQSKLGKDLSPKVRIISIVVLFVIYGIFVGESPEKKDQDLAAQKAKARAEQVAKIKQQNINYFNANRDQILSEVWSAIDGKEYEKAIGLAKRYLPANDPELASLNKEAETILADIKKKEKADNILSELKTVPSEEYEKNMALYKELIFLYPGNEKYSEKYKYYSKKVEEEKEKQRLADERNERIQSQFSSWNGSHRNLQKFIKNSMNDPDSYKHDKTVYWDMGDHLVVLTTFRGKNAFGGVVRNSVKAKVGLDGRIIKIIEQY